MQETVTMTKDELQKIVAEAVASAMPKNGHTLLGPEVSEGNIRTIREIVTGPGRWAVVYKFKDYYRIVSYEDFQKVRDHGSKLGQSMRAQGRGIFKGRAEAQ